ncbi:uncharacterized protein LOC135825426 [Sycon ciliatum]|uniref:uncharacterized protein LOC135825426 n=1 Tax=Sycon ciliatum TaxID=27933 RepID=UPI0020AA818E
MNWPVAGLLNNNARKHILPVLGILTFLLLASVLTLNSVDVRNYARSLDTSAASAAESQVVVGAAAHRDYAVAGGTGESEAAEREPVRHAPPARGSSVFQAPALQVHRHSSAAAAALDVATGSEGLVDVHSPASAAAASEYTNSRLEGTRARSNDHKQHLFSKLTRALGTLKMNSSRRDDNEDALRREFKARRRHQADEVGGAFVNSNDSSIFLKFNTSAKPLFFTVYEMGGRHGVALANIMQHNLAKYRTSREVLAADHQHPLRLVYNKVGKCGSRAFVRLAQKLAARNKFLVVGSMNGSDLHPTVSRVKSIRQFMGLMPTPVFYHRHLYYVSFPDLSPPPIFINMIRHPLNRAISSYYFRRFGDNRLGGVRGLFAPGTRDEPFETCILRRRIECIGSRGLWYIIPFFCGYKPFCRRPSAQSLALAKENVVNKYFFVGLSEYFNESIVALETLLPKFFSGAQELMSEIGAAEHTTKTNKDGRTLGSDARARALSEMAMEIEFYEFVRERFFQKLSSLHIPYKTKL